MKPPFTISSKIIHLIANINELVGRATVLFPHDLRLRRVSQIRTIQGTLAIEGNELSREQITAIFDGKRVLAPVREVQEARNAIEVYQQMANWQPGVEADLFAAHRLLMLGLIDSAGSYRRGGAGVMRETELIHLAPPADRVPFLMESLLQWLATSDEHPLIVSSVFHYEFEFIHPFADGNGRMGRLWQTLILSQWQPIFSYLPVENLIHQNQSEYYRAINESNEEADSRAFIEFMLTMILNALQELDL